MSIERTGVVSATDCQRKIIKEAGKSGEILHENDEQSSLICDKEQRSGPQEFHSVMEEEYSGKLHDILLFSPFSNFSDSDNIVP